MAPSVATVHGRLRAWARVMKKIEGFTEEASSNFAEIQRLELGGLPLMLRQLPPRDLARRSGRRGPTWVFAEGENAVETRRGPVGCGNTMSRGISGIPEEPQVPKRRRCRNDCDESAGANWSMATRSRNHCGVDRGLGPGPVCADR